MTALVDSNEEQITQSCMAWPGGQGIRGREPNNAVKLVEREAERTDAEHTNILRWEEDGGQAIEHGDQADKRNNQPRALPATEESGSLPL
jgi:hypothetical protein